MNIESGFEGDLEAALLDDAERRLVGEFDPIIFDFVQAVHDQLESYADEFGYEIESTIDSLAVPDVDRSAGRLTITVGWESEQMARWEFGTTDHTIDGDPVLSFVWEENDKRANDPPQWVRDEFEQEGDGWRVFLSDVDVRGLPESRAIRDNLNALRRRLQT